VVLPQFHLRVPHILAIIVKGFLMHRRMILIFLALLLLTVVSACGNNINTAATPVATPTPTPIPDFSDTDFSDRWYVAEIIDSNGVSLSETEKQDLGAGFTLELLPSGTYFVYDENGQALGQGDYSVTMGQLTLTAQDAQTVYEIVDADTLRITQPDASVTVMKRETKDICADADAVNETADDTENSDVQADAGAVDDTAEDTENGDAQGETADSNLP
jgi:hypothetical protein